MKFLMEFHTLILTLLAISLAHFLSLQKRSLFNSFHGDLSLSDPSECLPRKPFRLRCPRHLGVSVIRGSGELSEVLTLRPLSPIWDREPVARGTAGHGSESQQAPPSDSEQSSKALGILRAINTVGDVDHE